MKYFCSPSTEWLPKSFRSPNAKETNVVSVTCNGRVEMLEKNITAPFKFLRGINTFIFSLKVLFYYYQYSSLMSLQKKIDLAHQGTLHVGQKN